MKGNIKNIKSGIILLIISIVFIFVFLYNGNIKEVYSVIRNSNPIYLLLSVLIIILCNVFKGMAYLSVFKNMNLDENIVGATKFALISQLFDGITPFSSGEQPYQVYYLKKRYGIGYSASFGYVFYTSLMYQTAFLIVSTISIILNNIYKFITVEPLVLNLIYIGYVVTLLFTLVLFFINVDRKRGKRLLEGSLKFLNKIKLLNENRYKKLNASVEQLFESLKELNSDYSVLVKSILSNVVYVLTLMIVPLYIMNCVFPDIKMPIIATMIASNFIALAVVFIPIPGGTIGQEFVFLSLFKAFATPHVVSAGMLLWRFFTYYFVMLVGFILFLLFRKERKKDEVNSCESENESTV